MDAVGYETTEGFGLPAPLLNRMLISGKHRLLIPFASLIGATLLIGADAIGRTLFHLAPLAHPVDPDIIKLAAGGES